MGFNKTIAAFAFSASSAFALIGPGVGQIETKALCLDLFEGGDGSQYAGKCDQTRNNHVQGFELLENGCTINQVAITAVKRFGSEKFDIEVRSCLPPNVVQL